MDEAFKQLFDKSEITLDLSSADSINKSLIECAYFFWNAAWLESARRADRKAREECCEIVRAERIANECKIESDEAYNTALTHAEQAIRATIPEQPK